MKGGMIGAVMAMCLAIGACDAPPETIAGKVIAKVEQICTFRASQTWLEEVIAKANATIQMVDELANQICVGVNTARNSPALGLKSSDCPHGSIVVAGEVVCIEGEDKDIKGK
jgi:hypothetical protein